MDYQDGIITHMHNPEELEKLYRQDEKQFKAAFEGIFKEHPYEPILQVWYQRLNYIPPRSKPGTAGLFWWAFPLALLAAILTRWLWDLRPSHFIIDGLLYFPTALAMGTYLSVSRVQTWRFRLASAVVFLGLAAFFYFIPLVLTEPYYAHKLTVLSTLVPVILFFFLGWLYTGKEGIHTAPRLDFIKACGTGMIFSLPLVIGGVLLLGLGVFLFKLLGYEVMDLTANISILLVAGAAVPVAAAHMVETQGFMVKNLLALLAKIFTPLLLILTVGFLVLTGVMNQNPFEDRDFLLVINYVLVTVLGMTLLSLSDLRGDQEASFGDVILFALIIVGVLIGGIALSAALYRMNTFSVTPVKTALMGFNILVLVHFFVILFHYLKFLRKKCAVTQVQRMMVGYLPVYLAGALVAASLIPFLAF